MDKAILNLSSALGMSVVAEVIETDKQLQILQEINCPFGQGYFFAKPVALEDVIQFFFADVSKLSHLRSLSDLSGR